MPSRPRCQTDRRAEAQAFNRAAADALNDLHGYALLLDAEYHRMGDRLNALARADRPPSAWSQLFRERADLAEELEAFRGAIAELRRELPQAARSPGCDRRRSRP